MAIVSPTRILLFGGLAAAAALLLGSREAGAAELPPRDPITPVPRAPTGGAIPRRGPNGTVLLADLPADCRGYYDAAFGLGGATGCGDARAWSEELDRLERQYESGDPFFDLGRYEEALRAYEYAAARCSGAAATEAQAIATWVECLERNGLSPDQVWAG